MLILFGIYFLLTRSLYCKHISSLLVYFTSYFSKITSDDYQICKMKVPFVSSTLNTGSYTNIYILLMCAPYVCFVDVLFFSVWGEVGNKNHSKYLQNKLRMIHVFRLFKSIYHPAPWTTASPIYLVPQKLVASVHIRIVVGSGNMLINSPAGLYIRYYTSSGRIFRTDLFSAGQPRRRHAAPMSFVTSRATVAHFLYTHTRVNAI